MTYDLNEISSFLQKTAEIASAHVRQCRAEAKFCTDFKTSGARNLVTDADRSTEALIISAIRERFPSHYILSEESSPLIAQEHHYFEPLWIIDPIDGTTNFAYGLPNVGVSIAFADRGEVRAGVVGAPFQDEIFFAARGEGAYCNGERIRVGSITTLEESIVATGFPYERNDAIIDEILAKLRPVLLRCRDVRRGGASTLDISWVACGRHDVYYESLNTWDMAAASLIAREAGAIVRTLDEFLPDWETRLGGLPKDLYPTNLVVASPALIDQFIALIRGNC